MVEVTSDDMEVFGQQHVVGHLLLDRDQLHQLVPVEARVAILDVDLADMNETGSHRLHDLGDGVRYAKSCELSRVQVGDGVEDRQHKILKCAVLDAEIQCWTKRVRFFSGLARV